MFPNTTADLLVDVGVVVTVLDAFPYWGPVAAAGTAWLLWSAVRSSRRHREAPEDTPADNESGGP